MRFHAGRLSGVSMTTFDDLLRSANERLSHYDEWIVRLMLERVEGRLGKSGPR